MATSPSRSWSRRPSPEAYTAPTRPDDICLWLYTSGSTGRPKGAVHLHADLRHTNELYGRHVLGLTEQDVCYSVAKLFFAFGLGNALTFPLCGRRHHHPAAGPADPRGRRRRCCGGIRSRCSTGCRPSMRGFSPARRRRAATSCALRLCVSAGEALPAPIGQRWRERYGVDILDGLGSTEMLHTYLSNRPGEVKYGTTGKPVPGYDIRLVGDAGEVVKQGEIGELHVRGPTSAIMYWNNRELSRTTFLGEWTRSGDKYRQDEDGFFVYCGRRDDMLKVGGMYVSPFEVEGALCTHPAVLEAAVVAWPDPEGLDQAEGIRGAAIPRPGQRRARPHPAGALQIAARALQISAGDRVPQRLAEDRDRQDPTLQAAGRERADMSSPT